MSGQIPDLQSRPDGCVFAPRCPVAIDICQSRPALEAVTTKDGTTVRCHRWPEIAAHEIEIVYASDPPLTSGASRHVETTILDARDVRVHFPLTRSLKQVFKRAKPELVKAVDGVSITVEPGRTLGLVGESGSGKTTLARAVVGLNPTTDGEMSLLDIALPSGLKGRGVDTLREVQYVFQNPEGALNPYLTVGESLRRPLMRLSGLTRVEADREAGRLLEDVRLSAEYAQRYPRQLSGGEKQRVAIARAFAANPALLIGDEAVSALDVSVQASVLNLLNDLQTEHGNAILFISHDLAVVSYLADEIAVMYLGHVVEFSSAENLLHPPHHPYTEALLSAIPNPDPDQKQISIHLSDDVPSAINVPTGCPFHTRCPRYLGDICRDEMPPWLDSAEGARIRCHIPLTDLTIQQTSKPTH
jgi:peptide/nickel transport system ATP-binding protein